MIGNRPSHKLACSASDEKGTWPRVPEVFGLAALHRAAGFTAAETQAALPSRRTSAAMVAARPCRRRPILAPIPLSLPGRCPSRLLAGNRGAVAVHHVRSDPDLRPEPAGYAAGAAAVTADNAGDGVTPDRPLIVLDWQRPDYRFDPRSDEGQQDRVDDRHHIRMASGSGPPAGQRSFAKSRPAGPGSVAGRSAVHGCRLLRSAGRRAGDARGRARAAPASPRHCHEHDR